MCVSNNETTKRKKEEEEKTTENETKLFASETVYDSSSAWSVRTRVFFFFFLVVRTGPYCLVKSFTNFGFASTVAGCWQTLTTVNLLYFSILIRNLQNGWFTLRCTHAQFIYVCRVIYYLWAIVEFPSNTTLYIWPTTLWPVKFFCPSPWKFSRQKLTLLQLLQNKKKETLIKERLLYMIMPKPRSYL